MPPNYARLASRITHFRFHARGSGVIFAPIQTADLSPSSARFEFAFFDVTVSVFAFKVLFYG